MFLSSTVQHTVGHWLIVYLTFQRRYFTGPNSPHNVLVCSTHFSTVHYNKVKCRTVQQFTFHCSTVQYSKFQYSSTNYCLVQYSAVQCSTVHFSVLHCVCKVLDGTNFISCIQSSHLLFLHLLLLLLFLLSMTDSNKISTGLSIVHKDQCEHSNYDQNLYFAVQL